MNAFTYSIQAELAYPTPAGPEFDQDVVVVLTWDRPMNTPLAQRLMELLYPNHAVYALQIEEISNT